MERSYIISPTAGISTNIGISTTANPEVNPSSSIVFGIFRCNKTDLDFVYTNSQVPYISAKTSVSSNGGLSSVTINTPQCSAGDLLLFSSAPAASTGTWSSASGWTLEKQSGFSPNNMPIYSRIATGSESPTYTFNYSVSTNLNGIMICIKNWSSYTVGNFGAQSNPPTIPVPDDTSTKKLLLFFISNDGGGRTWDITTINEFDILTLGLNSSLQLKSIYRASSNTSLSYATLQDGAGSSSHGITIVVK